MSAPVEVRSWRCDCGARASGERCVHGHAAPWLNGGKVVVQPEPVRGVMAKRTRQPTGESMAEQRMVNGIVIEKGIPMPTRASAYPWLDMQVGDSFFVACAPEDAKKRGGSIANSGKLYLRKRGVPKAATAFRSVDGGVRIWRTA